MILKGACLFSFFLFLVINFIVLRYKNLAARRKLTGYEIARYMLDQAGLSHFSIQAAPSANDPKKGQVNYFPLEKQVSESGDLLVFCRIAQEVLFAAKSSSSVFFNWTRTFWAVAGVLIPIAWVCVLISVLEPSWRFLYIISWSILAAAEIVALLELSDVFNANSKAYRFLKGSGFFEIEELIRMHKILRALKLEGLTRIFKIPCDIAALLITGRKLY